MCDVYWGRRRKGGGAAVFRSTAKCKSSWILTELSSEISPPTRSGATHDAIVPGSSLLHGVMAVEGREGRVGGRGMAWRRAQDAALRRDLGRSPGRRLYKLKRYVRLGDNCKAEGLLPEGQRVCPAGGGRSFARTCLWCSGSKN